MADKSTRKTTRPEKKRWRRPAIKSGQLFEANSLSCGKAGPGPEQCMQFATTS